MRPSACFLGRVGFDKPTSGLLSFRKTVRKVCRRLPQRLQFD
jgi:hypothetical protein